MEAAEKTFSFQASSHPVPSESWEGWSNIAEALGITVESNEELNQVACFLRYCDPGILYGFCMAVGGK